MTKKEERLFNEVFLKYYPMLSAFGRKIVADPHLVEETIQDLFVYIFEKKVDLSSIHNLKAYLFTSFRRRILKEKKKELTTELITDIHYLPEDFQYDNDLQLQRNQALAKMLNALPWRQREAVFLKYFNNLSAKEVAEIMDIQSQVVSNTIYKALKKMKEMAGSWPILFLGLAELVL